VRYAEPSSSKSAELGKVGLDGLGFALEFFEVGQVLGAARCALVRDPAPASDNMSTKSRFTGFSRHELPRLEREGPDHLDPLTGRQAAQVGIVVRFIQTLAARGGSFLDPQASFYGRSSATIGDCFQASRSTWINRRPAPCEDMHGHAQNPADLYDAAARYSGSPHSTQAAQ
jgi:hypothetical protein